MRSIWNAPLALCLLALPALAQEGAEAPTPSPPPAPAEGESDDPAAGEAEGEGEAPAAPSDEEAPATDPPAEPAEGADSPAPEEASPDEAPDALVEEPSGPGDDPAASPEAGDDPAARSDETAPQADDDPLFNDEERYRREGEKPAADEGKGEPSAEEKAGKKRKEKVRAKKKRKRRKPSAEREPAVYSPDGLSGVAIWPMQVCGGCATLGVLELITAPLALIPVVGWIVRGLVMWGVASTVMTTIGDGLGKNRGAIGWPMVTGFCVDSACVGATGIVTGALAIVLFGSALLGAIGLIANLPSGQLPDGEAVLAVAGVGTVLLGLVVTAIGGTLFAGSRCASLNAASATYFMAADDKRDDTFRFPGFFTPNHGEPDAPARRRDRRDDRDEGYDDEYEEDYDEEAGDYVRALPGELGPPRLADAGGRNMAF